MKQRVQSQKHRGQRDNAQQTNHSRSAARALELASILDEVAGRKRRLNRRQPLLDIDYHAVQITPRRVALDDNPSPNIFPVDRIGAAGGSDAGHGFEWHSTSGRKVERKPSQLRWIL